MAREFNASSKERQSTGSVVKLENASKIVSGLNSIKKENFAPSPKKLRFEDQESSPPKRTTRRRAVTKKNYAESPATPSAKSSKYDQSGISSMSAISVGSSTSEEQIFDFMDGKATRQLKKN